MNSKKVYDNQYYASRDENTKHSARYIISILKEQFKISSAVDFGCGVGTWLRTVQDLYGGGQIFRSLGLMGIMSEENFFR